jgi:hypothetical protein
MTQSACLSHRMAIEPGAHCIPGHSFSLHRRRRLPSSPAVPSDTIQPGCAVSWGDRPSRVGRVGDARTERRPGRCVALGQAEAEPMMSRTSPRNSQPLSRTSRPQPVRALIANDANVAGQVTRLHDSVQLVARVLEALSSCLAEEGNCRQRDHEDEDKEERVLDGSRTVFALQQTRYFPDRGLHDHRLCRPV